jgi:hypothetical protein
MDNGEQKTQQYIPSFDFANFYLLQELIEKYFQSESVGLIGDMVRINYDAAKADQAEIRRVFEAAGYKPHFSAAGGRKTCILVPLRGKGAAVRKRENRIALLLFVATLITTTMAGWYFAAEQSASGKINGNWPGALGFSLCLLLILGSHEMAHKWASRRHGIDSTPPYFIPLPSVIPFVGGFISFGTMGAVIRVKSPMPDRNAAVALGISGPLAGFLVALPILIAGIILSKPIPMPHHTSEMAFYFNDSLIILLMQNLFAHVPKGYTLSGHPIIIAAWIGMFVTSLNLIPMGQLDGGHIAHAMLGDKNFRILCIVLIAILAAMSYFWAGWFLWAVIGYLLTRRGYPKSLNDEIPLTPLSRVMAAIGLILIIITFMPIPMIIK